MRRRRRKNNKTSLETWNGRAGIISRLLRNRNFLWWCFAFKKHGMVEEPDMTAEDISVSQFSENSNYEIKNAIVLLLVLYQAFAPPIRLMWKFQGVACQILIFVDNSFLFKYEKLVNFSLDVD